MKKVGVIALVAGLLVLAGCGPQAPVKVKLEPAASYGEHGVAVAPEVGGANRGEVGLRLLKTPGRVVLVGHGCSNGSAQCDMSDQSTWIAAAWAFDENGNPDASYGTGGTFADENAVGGNGNNVIFSAALTSSGPVYAGDGLNGAGDLDGVLWALTENGTLDTTRFSAGKANLGEVAESGAYDFVDSMKAAAGRIWLAGGVNGSAGHYQPAIWAVRPDGTPDTTFDMDGVYIDTAGNDHSWFDGLDVSGGAPIACGSIYDVKALPVVVKALPGGGLDASFGSGGRAYLPLGDYAMGRAIAVRVVGDKIVVAGYIVDADQHIAIWRLNADGSADASFGDGGRVVLAGVSPVLYADKRVGLAVDEKGRYWVVGGLESAAGNLDMAVWRIMADGKLDPDFCEGAPCTFDNAAGGSGDDWGSDILLEQDAVYIGGWSWNGSDRDAVVWKLGVSPAN